jgi:pimeloyl-ACP methyl ester carboxylesterase
VSSVGTYVEASELRVYYEVYGKGEPLLLSHGGTTTSQFWASHLPTFTERFRVFASDSRGHSKTDTPTGDLGYRAMADDAAALIKALGLRRSLVLGYSVGGQIALELGMRYPGMAGALVLDGTQFRCSEAYLEAVRALLGIVDGEKVDTGKLEREQPDWVAYLREAQGDVYGL